MKTLQEEDLIFDFTFADKAERFDDKKLHGNKSTMKKVDFILEDKDRLIFLEVKDPDIPGAQNIDQFRTDLNDGALISDLAGKYRDSLLFSIFRGPIDKPVDYVVLLSMAVLEDALILHKIDALKKAIPLTHKRWGQPAANSCVILKLDTYKKIFGDQSVWRASDF
ncbi:hypothetical protein CXF86_11680 [Shewanella sp. GutCb]|uniref:hypothetical protein n=1 Tax=Shewanella sp. GutCb TaxID=2058315 RepID=UPI000C7DD8DE|nr:hypothetical protein [Shewanella sp. GutCb]PKG74687.1 hypothetical protein CXF86_11680 [Shewanella sp. GutCb]